ncbi:MAG: signal peptidase I [Anaerolineae bacterium]|nr:signal peptidase I [Anaerolineae bacterium]
MIHSDSPGLPDDRKQPVLVEILTFVFRELFLETIAPAFVIALLITYFVGEKTVVLGHSMEPSLHQDEQLIVDKLSYRFHYPERGDIVIVDVPDSNLPLIKRVIGLPGETLEIKDNRVFINGQALSEPYLSDVAQHRYGPIEIPPEHIFVMGDNRNASRDSRAIGPVRVDQIIARAWVRVWPVEDMGLLK